MFVAHNCIHEKSNLVAAFLDSSRAFDTVISDISLDKVDHIRVRGSAKR